MRKRKHLSCLIEERETEVKNKIFLRVNLNSNRVAWSEFIILACYTPTNKIYFDDEKLAQDIILQIQNLHMLII